MTKLPELRTGVPVPQRKFKKRPNSMAQRIRELQPGQMLFWEGLDTRQVGARVHSVTCRLKPATFVVRAIDGGAGLWRVS